MKLRTFILVWVSVLAVNLVVMVFSYLNGNGYWVLLQLVSIIGPVYFAGRMWQRHLPPRGRRLSLERVRLLSAYDLHVLEAVLAAYDGSRVFPVQLGPWVLNIGWEADANSKDAFAAFDHLMESGLLRDGKRHKSEKVRSLLPHSRAQEVLEQELERRGKVHPIGPRSRSSALSS